MMKTMWKCTHPSAFRQTPSSTGKAVVIAPMVPATTLASATPLPAAAPPAAGVPSPEQPLVWYWLTSN
ncbi:hypothetical protein FS749_010237 [Ceratobasidium sp. UAMH 11750]|nr:hypothetical protein FS749_010237 [Ceratobasidium sp. UAMH 11750]